MKKQIVGIVMASAAALLIPASSLAVSVNLYNGGLGQVAGNANQFGIAICNGGKISVAQSAPISISGNGQTATESSASSIQPGQCQYTYIPYSALAMQAGQTYSVSATIDPQHTMISNANNQATYSVTVPSPATAQTQSGNSTNGTADINAQSGNIFTAFINWLEKLF